MGDSIKESALQKLVKDNSWGLYGMRQKCEKTESGSFKSFRFSQKGKRISWILTVLCPIWIVLITEVNQKGDFSSLAHLILERPTVLAFDLLLISAFYGTVFLLVRRSGVAATIVGGVFFLLSNVELYRFQASGTHFTAGDFSLFTNIGDVAQFAELTIYPMQLAMLAVLVLCLGSMYCFEARLTCSYKRTASAAGGMAVCLAAFFVIPQVSGSVFSLFGVSYGGASNNFVQEEKFQSDSMIAFLAENISSTISTVYIPEPENYSRKTVETFAEEEEAVLPQPAESPNVILIMSESYTDFRRFPSLEVSNGSYRQFDRMASQGAKGTAVVPTFGGYTVKTEFELLFGLPIKGLNGTQAPQFYIGEGEQATIARHFQQEGYTTAYLHPYSSDFYDRGRLLPHYGFDHIYFEEDMEQRYFRSYLDDKAAYDKALEELEQEENPCYIHITTMQNHMPYDSDTQSQFDYYMDGIENTDKRLGELCDALEALDEPTLVLFMGDHFPLFTEEGNAYQRIGIDADNCLALYQQPYVIWGNYELDRSVLPSQTVSSFYLPHVLEDMAGLTPNEADAVLANQMVTTPVYTTEYDAEGRNEALDTLTYDLILGDQYAADSN